MSGKRVKITEDKVPLEIKKRVHEFLAKWKAPTKAEYLKTKPKSGWKVPAKYRNEFSWDLHKNDLSCTGPDIRKIAFWELQRQYALRCERRRRKRRLKPSSLLDIWHYRYQDSEDRIRSAFRCRAWINLDYRLGTQYTIKIRPVSKLPEDGSSLTQVEYVGCRYKPNTYHHLIPVVPKGLRQTRRYWLEAVDCRLILDLGQPVWKEHKGYIYAVFSASWVEQGPYVSLIIRHGELAGAVRWTTDHKPEWIAKLHQAGKAEKALLKELARYEPGSFFIFDPDQHEPAYQVSVRKYVLSEAFMQSASSNQLPESLAFFWARSKDKIVPQRMES